jgi:hypothetical protein
MQPSLRSTPPSGPRKDDTPETDGAGRVIAGIPFKAGTAANCLTEILFRGVTSDMINSVRGYMAQRSGPNDEHWISLLPI